MMLMVFALNIAATHRRADVKSNQEAIRLQSVLLQELITLAELYEANIALIESRDQVLMSVRSPMNVYRANLGRLSTIDARLANHLISIHARNEHLEMILSARAKTVRGGAVTVYIFEGQMPVHSEISRVLSENLAEISECVFRHEGANDLVSGTPVKVNDMKGLTGKTSALPIAEYLSSGEAIMSKSLTTQRDPELDDLSKQLSILEMRAKIAEANSRISEAQARNREATVRIKKAEKELNALTG